MDILLFSQLAELITASLLVLVLSMLYHFGKIEYIRTLRIAFGIYLLVVVLSLLGLGKNNPVIEGIYQYTLLIMSSAYFYKALQAESESLKVYNKYIKPLYVLAVVSVPLLLIAIGHSEYLEASGYLITGVVIVIVGIRWFTYVLPHILPSRVVGILLVLFGAHLTDFIFLKESILTFTFGYSLAAALEALLTFFLTLMHFSRLHELDQLNFTRYTNLFNNSSDAILLIETDIITDCNDRASAMFGVERSQIIGKTPMYFSPEIQENGRRSDEYGEELFKSAAQGKKTQFDWIHEDNQGKRYYCEISLFSISSGLFGAIIKDMTDKYAYEEEINFHKYYDAVTHLPKRELFVDRLGWFLEERHKKVGLIAFNIDNFKEINDQFGHAAGDEVLKQVADRVMAAFNKEITLTRLGGDEFVAIMDRLSHRNRIYIPIERIESCFIKPFEIFGNKLSISACLGVAYPESGDEHPLELLKNADLALNIAKGNGRGRVEFYSSSSKDEFTYRIQIEKDMRHGLIQGEFIPFYQPIVDSSSGAIIGAEALARWKKEDGSMVYPDVFIPVAEETELILQMGAQILDQVCRDCSQIIKVIPEFVVHVNLSPLQLKSEDIVQQIKDSLQKYELTARHLIVELTESLLIDERSDAGKVMKMIKDLGVRIALDDFGTGYSSLAYLTDMQVDIIKIDRSFVLKLPGDKKAKAMISHLVYLLQELEYSVVVEGVEEKDQAEYLISLKCDYIQGYYYYRPMALCEFNKVIGDN